MPGLSTLFYNAQARNANAPSQVQAQGPNQSALGPNVSATPGAPQSGNGVSSLIVPYLRGAKPHVEGAPTYSGLVINGVASKFADKLPAYGYLRGAALTVNATGGTGVAAVAYEDAPWSIISNILFTDSAGTQLINLDGYSLFLAMKFGGYLPFPPDVSTFGFSNVATSGNFLFVMHFFVEFGLGGLGDLPNMDSSAAYKFTVQFANAAASATGPVYTTAPTGFPTLSGGMELYARMNPAPTDIFGVPQETLPPGAGSYQRWLTETRPIASGANTIILTLVGNPIRNHFLVFRGTDGTRATAETAGTVPTSIEFDWDAGQRYIINVATLRQWHYRTNGSDVPKGVVPFQNMEDPDNFQIGEYGDCYLPTTGATKLTLRFNSATTGNLTIVTNDVVDKSNGLLYGAPAFMMGLSPAYGGGS